MLLICFLQLYINSLSVTNSCCISFATSTIIYQAILIFKVYNLPSQDIIPYIYTLSQLPYYNSVILLILIFTKNEFSFVKIQISICPLALFQNIVSSNISNHIHPKFRTFSHLRIARQESHQDNNLWVARTLIISKGLARLAQQSFSFKFVNFFFVPGKVHLYVNYKSMPIFEKNAPKYSCT